MKRVTTLLYAAGLAAGTLLGGCAATAPPPGPAVGPEIAAAPALPSGGIEPAADRILREMGEYLKGAGEFTFRADVTYDAPLGDNHRVQYGGVVSVAVRRPNRLRADFTGDERKRRSYYNGKTFTIYNALSNSYATTDVPSTIDGAVDVIFEKYGFSVPIADLVYADPYAVMIENVRAGIVVGRHTVDGTVCHHLAFAQEGITWQVWVDAGPRPVPRKVLVTYKDLPGSPQYTARLSGWDFQPRLSDAGFTFHPPAGADEIEFLPIEKIGGQP